VPPEFDALVQVRWDAIDAVVFDIGGVFLVRHPDPIRNGMARGGFALPSDEGSLYHDAHYQGVRALTNVIGDGNINEYSRDFWINFEHAYLSFLGVPEDQLEKATETMFAEVFQKEAHPIWRMLLHENIGAFKQLGASGMPVAIVTNNDGTAEAQMRDFGICQIGEGPLTNVAAIVDSGILKIAKPEPGIFTPALEALGTDPARTLYVGDTVHADVVGATRAGMPVVQLDPLGLHHDLPHTKAAGVSEVVALLGR
jgi:putative hydrolase of the HAD superfamily